MVKPLNILVVDDDQDNANSLAELFEMDRRKAIVACNGQQAIAAFTLNSVDDLLDKAMAAGALGVFSIPVGLPQALDRLDEVAWA